tara:strand:+ start:769 stop:1140 length:372 start_codon:yes stop_codon:yes gene_type:complete
MKNLLVITLLFSSFVLYSQQYPTLDCERENESPATGMSYTKIKILQFKSGGTIMFNNFPMTIIGLDNDTILAEREYKVGSFPKRINLRINRITNDVYVTRFIKEFGKDEWKETTMRYHTCKLR